MTRGKIRKAPDVAGVVWARPFALLVASLCGWCVVGRYETEAQLRAAARRRGITINPEPSGSKTEE